MTFTPEQIAAIEQIVDSRIAAKRCGGGGGGGGNGVVVWCEPRGRRVAHAPNVYG